MSNPFDRKTSPRRPGKTLIELAIVVGIVGTVMTFVGQVLVGLFRVEGRTRAAVVSGLAVDRLGSRFREDVHEAKSIEVSPAVDGEPARCTLTSARGVPRTIEYVADGGAVTRRLRVRGDADYVGDTFQLGRTRASFEIEDERFVVLAITASATGDATANDVEGSSSFATRIAVLLPKSDPPPATEPDS